MFPGKDAGKDGSGLASKIFNLLDAKKPAFCRRRKLVLQPPTLSFILSLAFNAINLKRFPRNVSSDKTQEITQLLIKLSNGQRAAVDELLPLIYDELRSLAANYLRRERVSHTLQPTALVHEAYLKLVDVNQVTWQNRAHFFGVAANLMRRILIDYARQHKAEKRGGEVQKLVLDENIDKAAEQSAELVALDDALETLAKIDPVKSRIVELRYFGGLTVEETAEVLGVSTITVKRHWRMAKAWLYGQLNNNLD
jgi:RNA polymerase sigma factor, TIGR02999 family